ncbi:protein PAL OF QUIRKY-like [Bidens hawaiensis]|uniref:protein PAL OF QUIRKY-like n=1 Tax=Bidens hawaiensis TaxID=980011 RepID=UPI00404B4240
MDHHLPPPPTVEQQPPHSHSLPPLPTTKLRLMCSYGGHIVPRPQTKSLCYAGGETRIVAVDRRTTASTIASFTHHLSRTLYSNRPFTFKYQLPNEDLDSLISISTDEDLHNMLEEHDRIVSSPTPSRIRLFLFPTRPESVGSLLLDPKSESWFSDALKSTMIINRGLSDGSGMPNGLTGLECLEGNGESLMNSGDSGKCGGGGGDSGSVPESMVLETCSSFGSINSSVSASNLVPVVVGNEVKSAAPASLESDNSARVYQDQVLHDSESIIYNPSLPVQMQKNNIQVSGYQIPHIPDQRQQPVQYIHSTSPHYIQYPTGPTVPISSYYPMYAPYQQPPPPPHQPYPIYVMPVGPTDQASNVTAPAHITRVSQPPAERAAVAVAPQPIQSNRAPPHPATQPVGPTATPAPTYENEYDNDLVYAQIYKSQPSAPVFPLPKFETVKKAEQVSLSDASTQLPVGTSQQ